MRMHLIVVTVVLLVQKIGSSAEVVGYGESELNTIKEFRGRVKDVIVHDYEKENKFLIKWLKAQNMDLNKAEDMFRETQKWRDENNVDTVVNETIFDFKPSTHSLPGFDKEGHPIVIVNPGHLDVRRLLLQGKRDKLIRYWVQMLELSAIKTREASRIFGKDITQVTGVVDFHGFNIRQHFCLPCISLLTEYFSTLEKYYPEMIAHFVSINVPRIAIPAVDLIRPLLSPSTNKVMKLFDQDKKQWSKFLLEIADADQLPYRVGGTQTQDN